MRECARILQVNKKTVVRKMIHMGARAQRKLEILNRLKAKVQILEFDDLETFEHAKCKPVAVGLAVEYRTRWIVGYDVSQMAAKGLLAKKSLRKYGVRKDERARGRLRLFNKFKAM